jgi:hypothetical protein
LSRIGESEALDTTEPLLENLAAYPALDDFLGWSQDLLTTREQGLVSLYMRKQMLWSTAIEQIFTGQHCI